MRPLALICAISACLAGNAPSDDALLLARIRARMIENLGRLPDYTCVQTIERATRHSPRDSWRTEDLVRLEVAYVGDRELFGYPGGDQLDEAEVTRLVPTGAIGSGDFALLARGVFENPGAQLTVDGERNFEGRPAIRCDYVVPVSASTYRLRVPPHEAVVGYRGSFWVDRATLDLLRFEVNAERIPLSLGLSSSRIATDYQQMTFGDSRFSLPQTSELMVGSLTGWEMRNRTRFASYRQFRGESAIVFDDGAGAQRVAAAPPAHRAFSVKLPRDFSASLTLQTAIDSAAAAIGDPVRFRLERDLKHRNTTVIPKDAIFNGRIIRLDRRDEGYAVAFRLESVEFGDFRADLRSRRNVFSVSDRRDDSDQGPGFGSALLPREDRGAGGLITVLTDHLRWPKGFRFSLRSHLP
ncbi:MAG TPA: hypothetical protein VFA04_17915 [Bryobacteraceae bacterium]|nr:hypothetical protein [Bryobacteraceae bacterium]